LDDDYIFYDDFPEDLQKGVRIRKKK